MTTQARGGKTLFLTVVLAGLVGLGSCGRADPTGNPTGDPNGPPNGAAGSTVAAPDPAPNPAPDLAQVVAAVEDRIAVYDGIATGVTALVRIGDETKVVTAGLADTSTDERSESGQTFPIASVTKPMTTTLVLQLVEEGKLALDDGIVGLLPELKGADPTLTVEQLLSHRGGLRETSEADVERVGFDTADLVRASAGHPPEFAPGTQGVYSNVGFAALGLLVERILDQPLSTAFEERIFTPAHMDSSSLGGTPDVQGYANGKPVKNYYLNFLPAAGSVVATVGDVDAFFSALWSGRLLPDDVVADMQESRGAVLVDRNWRPDYGLGLFRWRVSCGTAIGHSGRLDGFTIEAWTLEGQERSVVVAVNDDRADDIARGIVQPALCDAA